MLKVDSVTYAELLSRVWDKKNPLFVAGGPGIGKSEIPRQVFKRIADKAKLKFVEWQDLTREDKANAIANPDEYFVFCDQRIGQMDSTDLRGIPRLDGEYLETCPLSWVIYFTQAEAHGVIFFDEINLAPPVVAGQAYQIINDRAIADRRLGKDVLVIAAGNRSEDKAFVFDMPLPLRDRFNEIEIYPSVKNWTPWAAQAGVNPHLVAFVNWKEMYLYTLDKTKTNADKGSSPRGIVRASRLVGDEDITSDLTHQLISAACGEAFATEFQAYTKHYQELDWEKIYKNPSMIKDYSADRLWAIAGGLSEHFKKDPKSKDLFEKIVSVLENMRAEFAIVTLRLIRDIHPAQFKQAIKTSPRFLPLAKKYGKYCIPDANE